MVEIKEKALSISSNSETSFVVGHNKQIAFLLDCIKTSQIPNAWLFHGPKGIGKSSLASNVAKVISNLDFSKPANVKNISEEDLRNPQTSLNINKIFHCKRRWDDKKKYLLKYISIEEIRILNKKFSLSSTDNFYQVCIIDTTEDLNLPASNSLLKILEEPPSKTLFILVSNNQQSILPTIFSRCQKIPFNRLNDRDLREIASNVIENKQFAHLEKNNLFAFSEGSVRTLLNFLDDDYVKLFENITLLLSELPNLNKRKVITLLDDNKEYIVSNDHEKSFLSILLKSLAFYAKKETNNGIKSKIDTQEGGLIAAHLYSQISLLRHQSLEYNIDAKRVLLLAFNLIELAFDKYKN